MTIRIFNPEHDIALASNMERFTAPHAGRQLRSDLGYLPAFWADEGDVVIVDDIDFSESAYRRAKAERKPKVEFCTMEQIAHVLNSSAIAPDIDLWGWDLAIRFQLAKAGVSEERLPSKDAVYELRRLSGRQCTTDILKKVRTDIESNTCGESLYLTDYKLFCDAIQSKKVVVKAPWSSSGRGVRYFIEDELPKNSLNWASNVIQQQGGVMVEPLYNKVKDFGMEFRRCADGSVKYLGLSLFHTLNGAYTGNLLATENVKREMLSKYISLDLLDEVTSRLERELTVLFSSLPSEKPLRSINLGVDMMIVTKDDCDGFLLHPCVEINLRRTMGHVALALSPTDDVKEGAMAINYESKRYHLRLK
jgi:hypothetical protein